MAQNNPLHSDAFREGFLAATGREPNQADYEAYQRQSQGLPPEATSEDQAAAYGQMLGKVGGAYAAKQAGAALAGGSAASSSSVAAPTLLAAQPVGGTAAAAGGAGASGATAAGGAAAAKGGAASGAGAAGTGGLAAAGGAALGAAGVYGLYRVGDQYGKRKRSGSDTAKAVTKGAAAGAALGSVVPGVGTALGAILGGAYGGVMARSGSGKSAQQMGVRDPIRARMQELGIMDDKYMVNGVDLGKDGGFRFDDGRKIYEVQEGQESGLNGEFDAATGNAVGSLNPLGYLLGDSFADSGTGYATGMLFNALKEGGEDGITTNEMRSLYDKVGGFDTAFNAIGDAVNSGELDLETGQAYQNALNQIYRQDAYADMSDAEYQASFSLPTQGPTAVPEIAASDISLDKPESEQGVDLSDIQSTGLMRPIAEQESMGIDEEKLRELGIILR